MARHYAPIRSGEPSEPPPNLRSFHNDRRRPPVEPWRYDTPMNRWHSCPNTIEIVPNGLAISGAAGAVSPQMGIIARERSGRSSIRCMSEVTRILDQIHQGDAHAAAQLLPLVYEELRRLAGAQMAQERPDHTLDATGLVHEAYLRLVGDTA